MTMEDYKFSNFINDFLIAKEVEEGCSSSTIKAYRNDLKKFLNFIGDININSPIMAQKIRIFLKKLQDLNYTKGGIARKIAALRSFFKFLTFNEILSKNPMNKIRSPKVKREENLPKFLDLKDVERIFTILKDKSRFNTKKSHRYYLLVRLLYSTMARVSELCNIKIMDVYFEEKYIRLRGKGNKERIVPVDAKTLEVIKDFLQNRVIYHPDEFLIVNTRNQKLSPRVIQEDIKTIRNECGFQKSKTITPHIFRHTGATHLRRSGMDISELQDILGHSNPSTTRIYAKNDITKLSQSYSKMHPLSKFNYL